MRLADVACDPPSWLFCHPQAAPSWLEYCNTRRSGDAIAFARAVVVQVGGSSACLGGWTVL